jgi:hypothetical protein
MKKILLLGSGLMSETVVSYLNKRPEVILFLKLINFIKTIELYNIYNKINFLKNQ